MSRQSESLDPATVRAAVRDVVEAPRYDEWLMEMPDEMLVRLAAPLEMLQFQFYLTPSLERHLVRAARVCCEACAAGLDACPADMRQAFRVLADVVRVPISLGSAPLGPGPPPVLTTPGGGATTATDAPRRRRPGGGAAHLRDTASPHPHHGDGTAVVPDNCPQRRKRNLVETILIVGGRVETLAKARDLGLRVLFMQHRDRMLPGHMETADALFMVDYTDWELIRPIVLAAHEAYGFSAVVSLGEQVMETVGRINDLLGLRGTSYEVSARFKDKLAMRAHLAESPVATVAAQQVDEPEQVREFASRHGFPVVLKPIDNTASRGVQIIQSADDVPAAWEAVTGLRTRGDLVLGQFFPVGRLLVERYIAGPEYSVESFSFGGRHRVVAITEKYTDGVIEAAHALPGRLSETDEAAVVSYISDFLTAMGLRDGVAHTEIKLSPDGPVVIESHDRIAGERIPDLVREAYEIDLEQYAVAAPFGLLPELPDRPEPLRAAATRFINAEPGVVRGFTGIEDVLSHPAVIELDMFVKEGDRRVPVTDNFERSGQVLVTGPDTATALETCDLLAGKITVLTT